MPKLQVLACPSCGASLSIEQGASTVQCAFCGNTSVVPQELRGPAPSARPSMAPGQKPVYLSGMPLMDQLPRLRELGDLVRGGRVDDAVRLYQDLFGANDAQARGAVGQLALGQPVAVSQFSALRGGSIEDAGLFRFDHSGNPQVQIQAVSSRPMMSTTVGSPLMSGGNMYGAPVIDTRPARQAGGCIAMIVVLSVVGTLAITGLALFAGFMPFFNFNSILRDVGLGDVGDKIAEVTNAYPRDVLSLGGEGTGRGLFTDARHVGVDGEGNIYAADYGAARVQVFDAAGDFVTQWTAGAEDSYLTGMAVGRDGTVYLVMGSDLYRYDGQTGDEIDKIEYVDGWGFRDVVALADGAFAATWYKSRDGVIIFDSDGETVVDLQEPISSVTGKSAVSMAIATDNDGNLLVLNGDSERVFIFGPDGTYLNSFGGEGEGEGQFRAPGDIIVDNAGQIYVSDIGGVQVFDASGRYVSRFDPPFYVYGMAVDDENFLYVAGNNHITKYQLAADN
jgi:LSD1 subclass zinc finger protein